MINSLKFSNVLDILKFFYTDTFHGLFNRPFFKSKINLYSSIVVVILLYLGYFYLNMVQLTTLSNGTKNLETSHIMIAAKMTLSSYFNVTLILSAFLFTLVNSTVGLSKNSLFFAKTLPFSEREISVSQKIFKLSVALAIFELVIIIVAPALKLIPMSIFTALLVLLTLHITFIAGFLIFELLYALTLRRATGTKRLSLTFLLDLIIIILSTVHLVATRYKIDDWVSQQKESIFQITLTIFGVSAIIAIIAYLINNKFLAKDHVYIQSNYFNLRIPVIKIGLSTTMPAVIRSKNFLYFWGLAIVITIGSILQNGIADTLQTLVFLLPILGISAISYADATLSVRKLFNLYQIKPINELLSLFWVSIILMLPALLVGIIVVKSIDPYLYGVSIFIGAMITGFLFPKSQSNINETISSVLTFVIIIILSSLININDALYPALVVLLVVLYLILKKEYEVPK